MQKRRKWRWAGKLARCDDADWMLMAIRWDPILDPDYNARRKTGRPKTRWTDDIYDYIQRTTSTSTDKIITNTNNHNRHDSNEHDNDHIDDGHHTDDTTTTRPTPLDHEMWLKHARDEKVWTALEQGFVNSGI